MQLFGLQITKAAVGPMTVANSPGLVPSALPISSWFGGIIQEAFPGMWQRNLVLGTGEITAFSAVYACISRIASDISMLRPKLMEINAGIWTELPESPFAAVLKKPNRYQTYIQFLCYWVICKLLHGNAYILKERESSRGLVNALYPLDPRGVRVLVAPDGDVFYEILKGEDLAGTKSGLIVPASEIIHDRGPTLWHPLCGATPIYACGASATQGVKMQSNSSKFFDNMSRPSGQLTAPGMISDETAKRLQSDFERNYGGTNIGRVLITGNGLKYEPMTIPFQDSQLIEQLKWTVEDVARVFHVPPHKIGLGSNPTFNNIGALNQDYLTQCLQTHIESIELLLDEGLELPKGRGTELDVECLLRLDARSQAEVNEIEIRSAVMKPNEARFIRNRGPVPGGDSPMAQQQNYSLEALAKRDAKEDPFGTAPPNPPKPPVVVEDDDSDEEKNLGYTAWLAQKELQKRFSPSRTLNCAE